MAEKCPWCGAAVCVVVGGFRGYGAVPPNHHWWECPNPECLAEGPRRPTRNEAVGTLGDVCVPDCCDCQHKLARAAAEAKLAESEKRELAYHDDLCRLSVQMSSVEAKLAEERKAHGELREALDKFALPVPGMSKIRPRPTLVRSIHYGWYDVFPQRPCEPDEPTAWTAADAIRAWARSVKR